MGMGMGMGSGDLKEVLVEAEHASVLAQVLASQRAIPTHARHAALMLSQHRHVHPVACVVSRRDTIRTPTKIVDVENKWGDNGSVSAVYSWPQQKEQGFCDFHLRGMPSSCAPWVSWSGSADDVCLLAPWDTNLDNRGMNSAATAPAPAPRSTNYVFF